MQVGKRCAYRDKSTYDAFRKVKQEKQREITPHDQYLIGSGRR